MDEISAEPVSARHRRIAHAPHPPVVTEINSDKGKRPLFAKSGAKTFAHMKPVVQSQHGPKR
jgi:hypothetical protein